MAKTAKHDDSSEPAAPKKQSVPEMLQSLADAYDLAEAKNEALAKAHQAQVKAVEKAQIEFDAVKSDYQRRVQDAAQEADKARVALELLRAAVNERVGTLTGQSTDPRVSVK